MWALLTGHRVADNFTTSAPLLGSSWAAFDAIDNDTWAQSKLAKSIRVFGRSFFGEFATTKLFADAVAGVLCAFIA